MNRSGRPGLPGSPLPLSVHFSYFSWRKKMPRPVTQNMVFIMEFGVISLPVTKEDEPFSSAVQWPYSHLPSFKSSTYQFLRSSLPSSEAQRCLGEPNVAQGWDGKLGVCPMPEGLTSEAWLSYFTFACLSLLWSKSISMYWISINLDTIRKDTKKTQNAQWALSFVIFVGGKKVGWHECSCLRTFSS